MTSYVLASASGLTVGFYFFLVMSAAIAFMIHVLLTQPLVRRSQFGLPTVRKAVAAPLPFLVWIVVFSAIYFSSLAGFHTVTVGSNDIRVEYGIPRRSVGMRYSEIGDVIRRPAYKLLWRLEIYTLKGSRCESAPGSYRHIKEAAEDIERRRKGLVMLAWPEAVFLPRVPPSGTPVSAYMSLFVLLVVSSLILVTAIAAVARMGRAPGCFSSERRGRCLN